MTATTTEIVGEWIGRIRWMNGETEVSHTVNGETPRETLDRLMWAVQTKRLAVNWFHAEISIVPLAILGGISSPISVLAVSSSIGIGFAP
jgi:hypothetical protein